MKTYNVSSSDLDSLRIALNPGLCEDLIKQLNLTMDELQRVHPLMSNLREISSFESDQLQKACRELSILLNCGTDVSNSDSTKLLDLEKIYTYLHNILEYHMLIIYALNEEIKSGIGFKQGYDLNELISVHKSQLKDIRRLPIFPK